SSEVVSETFEAALAGLEALLRYVLFFICTLPEIFPRGGHNRIRVVQLHSAFNSASTQCQKFSAQFGSRHVGLGRIGNPYLRHSVRPHLLRHCSSSRHFAVCENPLLLYQICTQNRRPERISRREFFRQGVDSTVVTWYYMSEDRNGERWWTDEH